MTPKEKAEELVNKFYIPIAKRNYPDVAQIQVAKQCALIAVNEILAQDVFDYTSDWSNTIEYWQEVKKEIEKL